MSAELVAYLEFGVIFNLSISCLQLCQSRDEGFWNILATVLAKSARGIWSLHASRPFSDSCCCHRHHASLSELCTAGTRSEGMQVASGRRKLRGNVSRASGVLVCCCDLREVRSEGRHVASDKVLLLQVTRCERSQIDDDSAVPSSIFSR